MRKINNFKVKKIRVPKGYDPKTIIRTPTSEFKEWETANGKIKRGGNYFTNQKKSLTNRICRMLVDGRDKDKLKMKLLKTPDKVKISEEEKKEILDSIPENRDAKYYNIHQQIKKIRVNSLYGAGGNTHFHLYDYNTAVNTTLGGQYLIKDVLSETFNNYFKNEFYKNTDYFDEVDEKNKCENDVVVLIDTDSVKGDTVLNLMDEDGIEYDTTIKGLFEETKQNTINNESVNFEQYSISIYNYKTLSVNNETQEPEYKKINYVYKTKVRKRMFEIEVDGKKVVVTKDHSLKVLRNDKIISVCPNEVEENDELITIEW